MPEPIIAVVACVLQRGGRYLVCQRPPSKRHGGLWEFPGGKLELGEDFRAAAHRELWEELGLELSHFGQALFDGPDSDSRFMISFVETAATGEPQLHEHDAVRWATLQELQDLPLAPSDCAFVTYLVSQSSERR